MGRITRLGATLPLCALLLSLAGCGGDEGTEPAPPQVPDLAGVWAGSWEGTDPVLGRVGGTWEADFQQSGTSLNGAVTLLGDVDCMFGTAAGAIDAAQQLSGTLDRAPCALNQWSLSALDVGMATASGLWSQPGSGAVGSLSGRRIAVAGGPRVLSVYPTAGPAGTLVTIRGQGFGVPAPNAVGFGSATQPAVESATAERWVVRVPLGATTGEVLTRFADGSQAAAPWEFRASAGAPHPSASWSVALTGAPQALVFSRDGRKVFVAERDPLQPGHGVVSVVHALTQRVLTRTMLADAVPKAIAASPDGRLLYAAGAGAGVLVLDAAVASRIATLPLPIADGPFDNPQGLSVSPDGRRLLVSDARSGGEAVLFDTASHAVLRRFAMATGYTALGVSFSADGAQAYVLAAADLGGPGQLLRFDVETGGALAPVALGSRPVGLAVTPDGRELFVGLQADHTVSRVDLANGSVTATAPVSLAPSALALSPDGQRLYVAAKDAQRVDVLERTTLLAAAPPVPLGHGPLAITIDPQGLSAVVALSQGFAVAEVGGARILDVMKSGTGSGSVRSSPEGIDCGTTCLSRFPAGTVVRLTPVAGANSVFLGWLGDAACATGVVDMSTEHRCVARFDSSTPPPNYTGPGTCFIATAAYGSAMAPQVQVLRDFRDRTLMHSALGRRFVGFYYQHSPAWAETIRDRDAARAAVRVVLWPVVFGLQHPVESAALSLAGLGMAMLVLRRRRDQRGGSPR